MATKRSDENASQKAAREASARGEDPFLAGILAKSADEDPYLAVVNAAPGQETAVAERVQRELAGEVLSQQKRDDILDGMANNLDMLTKLEASAAAGEPMPGATFAGELQTRKGLIAAMRNQLDLLARDL